jgi:hypothetical protein
MPLIQAATRDGFRIAVTIDNGVSPGDPPAAVLLGPSNLPGLTRLMVTTAGEGACLILTADELRALVTALSAELIHADAVRYRRRPSKKADEATAVRSTRKPPR